MFSNGIVLHDLLRFSSHIRRFHATPAQVPPFPPNIQVVYARYFQNMAKTALMLAVRYRLAPGIW